MGTKLSREAPRRLQIRLSGEFRAATVCGLYICIQEILVAEDMTGAAFHDAVLPFPSPCGSTFLFLLKKSSKDEIMIAEN